MSTTLTSSGYEVVYSHEIPFWYAGSAGILDDVVFCSGLFLSGRQSGSTSIL